MLLRFPESVARGVCNLPSKVEALESQVALGAKVPDVETWLCNMTKILCPITKDFNDLQLGRHRFSY
jgi:hypothetical protein